MGWWPFGTSTPNAPSKQPPVSDSDADSSRGGPVVAVNPKVADGLQHQPAIEPEPRDEPLSKPNVTLKRSSESWDYITQNIKPKIWSNGVSEWPIFGLGAIFLGSVPVPASRIPGLTPRLARLAFGGLFATAGFAIRSGDEYNGASIATWGTLSHVLLASITKSFRKELAKKTGKPLPRSSPLAGILTTATLITGVAYGMTI